MRESFVFYKSFLDAIEELDDKNQLKIYKAITNFALKNEEPTNLNKITKVIFSLIKPQITANNKRYEDGKKGGRPKKEKTTGFENKKTTGYVEEKPNVNVNDNVNVNANVNANENENVNAEKEKFNLFFNQFPKQVDEYKTFTLFDTLINEKIVTFDELMQGVKRYKEYTARSGTDEKFIKSPFNWLSDMSWKNKYEVKNDKPYRYNAFAN